MKCTVRNERPSRLATAGLPVLLVLALLVAHAGPECTDRAECWPDGSAMNTGLKAKERLVLADKELNAVYRRIVDGLPPDASDNHPKRALIAAQREWVKWRDARCASVGESGGGVRMWKSTYTVVCEADMTEARAKELIGQFEGSAD